MVAEFREMLKTEGAELSPRGDNSMRGATKRRERHILCTDKSEPYE